LAGAAPQFAARQTRALIIGPGGRREAERLAKTIQADPADILYDEAGAVYDQYMLDKAFFSLIQRSALLVIDRQGMIRHAYVVTNPINWVTGDAFRDLLATLESLEAAAT
jgi:peroxiredoxin